MIAALTGLADLLVRRSIPCTPRLCVRCARLTTRLTPAQRAQVLAGDEVTCRRRHCRGRLKPIPLEPTS
ncbi:hypothetical protein [Actinomadura geliboluensis]|uniref:hypothetical protein n=1 Tax=Actinomadura geliboluensis TaxID=882440 RepID=UPI003699A528